MDVREWLLAGDPAIRWQTLRDLCDAAPERVAAARARVAEDGWGARLLALQGPDGQWDGGACFPGSGWPQAERERGEQPWTSTLPVLHLLCELGVDPAHERVRRAVAAVRAGCRWEHAGQPFFAGEVEPCINGRTLLLCAHFAEPCQALVERLVAEQLADGGWNCAAENGSLRGSFATTINVLEGLLAWERAQSGSAGGSEPVRAARRRGEEYLLERRLLRRKSTGQLIDPAWQELAFPTRWRYDVLRALDHLRAAARESGAAPDPRLGEAIALLREKRQPDGTWLLERTHPGRAPFALEEPGQPSRWNTLRALRVLRWWEAAPGVGAGYSA